MSATEMQRLKDEINHEHNETLIGDGWMELPEGDKSENVPHNEIAKLAYGYWEERGRPFGQSEVDWFRAEKELQLTADVKREELSDTRILETSIDL